MNNPSPKKQLTNVKGQLKTTKDTFQIMGLETIHSKIL